MKLTKLASCVAIFLSSLAGCAVSSEPEDEPVRVAAQAPEIDALALNQACYERCMEDRTGADPVFNLESTHENPYGINPNWAAGTYRQSDNCYAQCNETTGPTRTPRRKFKLKP